MRPAPPSVHTVQSLARANRRLERQQRRATAVIGTMRRHGASLHLEYQNGGGARWRLSTGSPVASDVAALVTADPRVSGVGDTLFAGMNSQTFRYVE